VCNPARGNSSQAAPGANIWNAVIAVAAIGAFVFLTLKLVDHNGYTSKDVTSILGVAGPVFGAAFGIVLGAAAGNARGKAKGEETGKNKVLDKIKPLVNSLDNEAPAGAESLSGPQVRSKIDELQGMVKALG
jgi:hypothetical protein